MSAACGRVRELEKTPSCGAEGVAGLLAAGVMWGAARRAGVAVPPGWLVFVGGAGAAVYGMDHALEAVKGSARRRWGLWMAGGWAVAALGVLCGLEGVEWGRLGLYGLAAVGYVRPVPVLGRRLQDVPGLRNVLIPLAWTGMPTLWQGLSGRSWTELAASALWFTVLLMWSDRADRWRDRAAGRRTVYGEWGWPQVLWGTRCCALGAALLWGLSGHWLSPAPCLWSLLEFGWRIRSRYIQRGGDLLGALSAVAG